jgi:hypothetical protein
MHGPINVKSPTNISKWEMGFNSAFKGLKYTKEIYFFLWKEIPHSNSLIMLEVQHKISYL